MQKRNNFGTDVALNIVKVFSVTKEMHHWVPFALLHSYIMVRNVVNKQ